MEQLGLLRVAGQAANDGLDFEDVRLALLRIPEISTRLKSAQRVLDRERRFDVDLMTFMIADHETFRRYGYLRQWVGEIIKDGLCDRLARSSSTEITSPARHLPTLLAAVVAADPGLSWFWPAVSAGGPLDASSQIETRLRLIS